MRAIERVAALVARGEPFSTAASFVGIGLSSFKQWCRRGRKELVRLERGGEPDAGEALYAALAAALDQALAASEVRDLALIDKVAQGGLEMGLTTASERRVPVLKPDGTPLRDRHGTPITVVERSTTTQRSQTLPQWTAAAWRLERRMPEKYGRRVVQHYLRGEDGEPPVPQIVLPDNQRGDVRLLGDGDGDAA